MSSLAIQSRIFVNNTEVVNSGAENCEKKEPLHLKIKNCFEKAIKEFVSAIRHAIEFLAHAVATHDNIQSLCKFGKSTISFFKYAFKAESEGFNNLKNELEVVDSAIDVADFIVDIKDWFVPKEDPKDGQKKMFFNHEGVTKWKILSKAFGTASKGLGAFKFLLDVGIIKLARFSAYLNTIPFFRVIMQFSPLRVVKDSIAMVSASLAIVDHSIGVHRKQPDIDKADLRLRKWEAKQSLLKYTAANEADRKAILAKALKGENVAENEQEESYYKKLEIAYVNARNGLQKLGVESNRALPEAKWTEVKTNYQNGDLAALEKKCSEKVADKAKNLSNKKVLQNKDWLAIAFQAFKVAAIIIGLVGVFASLYGAAAFLLILGAAWFVTSSIGMARLYYGFKHRHVKA